MIILAGSVLLVRPSHPLAQGEAELSIERNDADGDGRISAREWKKKKKIFKGIDANEDGYLTLKELQLRFGEAVEEAQPQQIQAIPPSGKGMDGLVDINTIDKETSCGIGRWKKDCSIDVAQKLGMTQTGLRPRFPEGLKCRDIDEQWAIPYTSKRDREQYHGGIDMPAPYGTPMIAAADGTVVSTSMGEKSFRGKEIILRHSYEDTGIPGYWIYTQYAHFQSMPTVKIGERVKMGQNLGPTGNSGIGRNGVQSGKRRPAIHFAVWFSKSPDYALAHGKLIPVKGRWMDPNALYRQKEPFDSPSLNALPPEQKKITIPVMTEDGKFIPADTKLVWPYTCKGL